MNILKKLLLSLQQQKKKTWHERPEGKAKKSTLLRFLVKKPIPRVFEPCHFDLLELI